MGEPFRLFFQPEELADWFKAFGFARTGDWTAGELNGRYLDARTDGLRLIGNVARIMHARSAAHDNSTG